ncbi:hypothetical protein IFM89_024408 [Coptis chinensis]|uniref:ABC transmembrane type-1 domain-containing protein n=1 Tax=Coptis chinensis TaxID=261450 RepID=A0A835I3Q7_9MAGN|nr:hypothetical protein IFM89_024408 [Coptis chinensis]
MRDGVIVQSGKYNDLLEPETSLSIVANGRNKSLGHSESQKGTSKFIEDEERETGHVSFRVYKTYSTEAYGWWGSVAVLLMSLLWRLSLMAAVLCVFVLIRNTFVTYVGLETAQILCKQILHSILSAPMSFFGTTPSGRSLSREVLSNLINRQACLSGSRSLQPLVQYESHVDLFVEGGPNCKEMEMLLKHLPKGYAKGSQEEVVESREV